MIDLSSLAFCACMGPVGDDPYCPCSMRAKGLVATRVWSPEEEAYLEQAFRTIQRNKQVIPVSIYPPRHWLITEFMGARWFFWVAAGIADVILLMDLVGAI